MTLDVVRLAEVVNASFGISFAYDLLLVSSAR